MHVLYLQPYVPAYRAPLFDQLAADLAEYGHTFTVACGTPTGDQAKRGDTARGDWHVQLPSATWQTPLGEFKYRRRLGPQLRRADVCVMELDVGNLNAWKTLITPRRPAVVLWGHGKSYTRSARPQAEALKLIQARRADHVMTYTESGRRHLIDSGLDPAAVTAVGNATDTRALLSAAARRRDRAAGISETFDHRAVHDRIVAMYVGGLDADKRVGFLAEAAAHAQAHDPRFLLLVAGSGADQHLLQPGIDAGYIWWTPAAGPADLADLAAAATAIWMPGRVGLVAIDALALGLPVLTTPFPFHAPEFDYLTEGTSRHTLPDRPDAFALAALELQVAGPPSTGPDPTVPTIQTVAAAMTSVLTMTAGAG